MRRGHKKPLPIKEFPCWACGGRHTFARIRKERDQKMTEKIWKLGHPRRQPVGHIYGWVTDQCEARDGWVVVLEPEEETLRA